MNGIRVTSECRRVSSQTATRSRRERTTFERTAGRWSGFTLVELLVVVTVMLILIAMTVTAIDFSFTSERIRSGARQLASALEGARDRAIFAREARGIRLLVDPTEPRMVTALIYIGASKNWNEGRIRLERMDFEEDTDGDGQLDPGEDTNMDGRLGGNGVADMPQQVLIVRGDATCGWSALKERGFLGLFEDLNLNGVLDPGEDSPPNGNNNGVLDLDAPRIKIPADDNGTWYTVLTHRLSPTSQVLQLITPYRDPGTTPPTEVVAFQGGGPNNYILELPPRILPDAQPILLPEGVVIDLDASQVPADWRPGAPPSAMALEQQYLMPYSSHMDILFSPRGVVTGPLAAAGLLHLYLAERKDVVFAVDQGLTGSTYSGVGGVAILPRRPPRFGSSPAGSVAMGNPLLQTPLIPGAGQFTAEDQIGQRILISIFTQTGKVSTHLVNAVDILSNVTFASGSGSDGYADFPFLFATQGEAQSQ